jgi:hypothetical protein
MNYNILVVLAAFVPFVVAVVDQKPGNISWKFLTFCSCLQTVVFLAVARPIAIIVWLIGWGCAIATYSSTRRGEVSSCTTVHTSNGAQSADRLSHD